MTDVFQLDHFELRRADTFRNSVCAYALRSYVREFQRKIRSFAKGHQAPEGRNQVLGGLYYHISKEQKKTNRELIHFCFFAGRERNVMRTHVI